MSRVGKKPITIPSGVEAKMEGNQIFVKGPKGELSFEVFPEIEAKIEGSEITISKKKDNRKAEALWGTTRSLIFNIIEGVSKGFVRDLQVKGVGYRAQMQGEDLELKVGFSHPVVIKKVEGVDFAVNKDIISVTGIKKDLVGRLAAEIRAVRPPEPYKGKGIRYKDENIIIKEGKKGVGK